MAAISKPNIPSGYCAYTNPNDWYDAHYVEPNYTVISSVVGNGRIAEYLAVNGKCVIDGHIIIKTYSVASKLTFFYWIKNPTSDSFELENELTTDHTLTIKKDSDKRQYIKLPITNGSIKKVYLERDEGPKWIRHLGNGQKYLNEPASILRFKCFLLFLANIPFVFKVFQLTKGLINSILDLKIQPIKNEIKKLFDLSNVYHLIFFPLFLLIAAYGLLEPHKARVLYADCEKLIFGKGYTALCFQPSAKEHTLGGSIHQKNQF